MPENSKGIPDFVWIKNRDATDGHQVYDSSRGPLKDINPDSNAVEGTTNDGLQKFLKGGFEIEDDVSINTADEQYVAWNWVANGGTEVANTDGSGATLASTIQANQTAGFSIVRYTGTNSNKTIAHGLSSAPECIITKNLTASSASWAVYHKDMTSAAYTLFLDTTAAQTSSSTMWNSTAPTSSVFSVGANFQSNGSSNSMIAYCWHSVKGFSKFGTYEGNNNNDGAFVYLGFKPALLIVKSLDEAYGWRMYDNARNPANPMSNTILADVTTAENTSTYSADFLSNGFKQRDSYSSTNAAVTYIYMAWAEHPFNGDGSNAFATAR